MKNRKQTNLVLGVLILLLVTSCISISYESDRSKSKTAKEAPKVEAPQYTNTSRIPLIADCKDNHTEACLQNTISDRILNEANNRNLKLVNDTLQVSIRFNKDGSITTLKNNTTNSALKQVVEDVLNNMEPIEPAYIESIKSYEAASYSWFVLIKDNTITNRFE